MSALRWVTQTRFYQVSLQKDLFGDLSVLCVWGSRSSRHGRHKLIPCSNIGEARKAVRAIAKTRRRHNYQFVPGRHRIAF